MDADQSSAAFQNGVTVRQPPLFARKAHLIFPKTKPSADALGEVEADDSFRYHIKGDAHGRLVRASEWICSHIAEEVGLACPHPMVIELPDDRTVFGSRRISLVSDDTETANYLMTPSQSNSGLQIRGLKPLLSSIYALDMFIFNDDRHFGNYLSINDNGIRRLYAFDFSRSLFWHWPISAFPPENCNTRRHGKILWNNHGFDIGSAAGVIDRINGLDHHIVEGFVNRMPVDWLPDRERSELATWWQGRSARLADLRKGLTDGSLI